MFSPVSTGGTRSFANNAATAELGLRREIYLALFYLDAVYPSRVPASALAAARPRDTAYVHEVRDNNEPLHTWKAPLLDRFFDQRRQTELADTLASWAATAG